MAPQVKPKSYRQPKPKSAAPEASAGPSYKALPTEQRDPSGLPGISKIKASIRQTKRFLAKDNIEPGLKIATERRLRSLEADLMKAERRGLEKKNGGKYHMVKFFERQKLCRIIKRLHRTIDSSSTPSPDSLKQLEEARIMLNYVLHFPNDKKYVSIFPVSTSKSGETETKLTLPALLSDKVDATKLDKGEKKRLDILLETWGMMERGELSGEPEKGLGTGEERSGRVRIGGDEIVVEGKETKGKRGGKEVQSGLAEPENDFFESD